MRKSSDVSGRSIMKRLVMSLILSILCLSFTGCQYRAAGNDHALVPEGTHDASAEAARGSSGNSDDRSQPTGSSGSGLSVNPFTAYWDAYAEACGGEGADFSYPPPEVDLLPLYLAGLRHADPYTRWTCANRLFRYYHDERKPEIIEALNPLQADADANVRQVAEFSLEVLTGSFSGTGFIRSPNGRDVAFAPFMDARFNDGQVWLYTSENDQLSMVLQLVSVGGDSGVAGYITWSPDGRKLAVGDGGRLWSDIVVLNLDTLESNKKSLFAYLSENAAEFGYQFDDYQRPDPQVKLIEWSPDSTRVLLSYAFAESMDHWQTGFAVLNVETDAYELVMPGGSTDDDYPSLEKPEDFHW